MLKDKTFRLARVLSFDYHVARTLLMPNYFQFSSQNRRDTFWRNSSRIMLQMNSTDGTSCKFISYLKLMAFYHSFETDKQQQELI